MLIGDKNFKDHTYIMGILNVTPDSFSDGGKYNCIDNALKHAEKMISEGADVIDVGGESTRPGYTKISDDEEAERIAPIIEKIKNNFDIPVSADTYKSNVAKAAISAGADLINDIWGFQYDNNMASVLKENNISACMMHNRKNTDYTCFIDDVISDLKKSITIADDAGIQRDKLIIDPGIGFAKNLDQNLELINRLDIFDVLGLPVLLGTSRKSVIGLSLDLPVAQRLEGTIVTTVIAVQKKCLFVRVHDIKENKRAILMTEKIIGRS